MRELYPETGQRLRDRRHRPPGVGKSSLIGALIAPRARARARVGVVSVDPSSPFSQGALLGDRIRLSDHFLDPEVFIRSMGTRGHLGGLAEATLQALLLLDAAGKDLVFLETVGTGQSEVEVIRIADTVLLVLMPGSGDSVQALKAGIMEIPDVIAVNKMDHPAAKTMLSEVRSVLALDPRAATGRCRSCSPRRCAAKASTSSGTRSHSTATHLQRGRRARGAPAREPRGRGVRGRVRRARRRTSRRRSRRTRTPRLLDARAGARARPADGGRRDPRRRSSRDATMDRPGLADLAAARERLDGIARVTPVTRPTRSRGSAGAPVFLKAENLQRTGSFKIRGAVNTIAPLTRVGAAAGVVTASAGNHGQAVAWAARQAGIARDDLRARGRADGEGRRGPRLRRDGRARRRGLRRRGRRGACTSRSERAPRSSTPFDDPRVIAGQGRSGSSSPSSFRPGRGPS